MTLETLALTDEEMVVVGEGHGGDVEELGADLHDDRAVRVFDHAGVGFFDFFVGFGVDDCAPADGVFHF